MTIPGLVDVAPRLTDATIGMLGAVLLFILRGAAADGRSRPLITWSEARRIPWDVLLLFGGGLSLAAAMESTGLARWLGDQMAGLGGMPPLLIYLGLAVTVLLSLMGCGGAPPPDDREHMVTTGEETPPPPRSIVQQLNERARAGAVTDTMHGTEVPDPYRAHDVGNA